MWPRQTVGIVHKQGNVVLFGKRRKPVDFRIGKHVACRVGRAAHAHRAHIVMLAKVFFQQVKIYVILKRIVAASLKMRRNAHKSAALNALVSVAYVFRHQRKEQFLFGLLAGRIRKRAGKQIEQIKTRALAAVCNRHIFRTNFPSVCARKI